MEYWGTCGVHGESTGVHRWSTGAHGGSTGVHGGSTGTYVGNTGVHGGVQRHMWGTWGGVMGYMAVTQLLLTCHDLASVVNNSGHAGIGLCKGL